MNLRIGWRHHRLAVAVALIFVLAAILIGFVYGFQGVSINGALANLFFQSLGLLVISMITLLTGLVLHRPPSPLEFIRAHPFISHKLRRLIRAVPILLAVSVFLPAFSALKSQVGRVYPYDWDQAFIDLDYAIHGTDPWRLLQPLIGYPVVTFAIAMAYQVWILLLYIMLPLLCVWISCRKLATQVLLTYLISWIVIGAILANIFASVGPCFVEPFFGDDRFRPLMSYLQSVDRQYPLMFLDVQESLMEWKLNNESELGRGISAMPSMHVSIALIFFLATRRLSNWLGWLMGAFFVIILIGSVHTGYHYAVDGYAAIIFTLLIWYVSGIVAQRVHRKTG